MLRPSVLAIFTEEASADAVAAAKPTDGSVETTS